MKTILHYSVWLVLRLGAVAVIAKRFVRGYLSFEIVSEYYQLAFRWLETGIYRVKADEVCV